MVACGKDGQIYLLDRQNMGKSDGPGGPNQVLETVALQPGVDSPAFGADRVL